MSIKAHIPNAITSLNLLCGSRACLAFFSGENELGITLVVMALLFDFLDGFVARLLNVKSEIGKQLDSLADMVTFGLVPGIIMYVALNQASSWEMLLFTHTFHPIPYLAFLIPIFSAFRLAKFNIDARQAESFIGLPTPANTLLFLTIPLNLIYGNQDSLATMLLSNLFVLLGFTLLFSFLLVAEIPLLSIKFKNYSWKANKEKYLLLISSFIFLWFFNFLAPVFIIVLYLTLSLIHQKRQPKKNNP